MANTPEIASRMVIFIDDDARNMRDLSADIEDDYDAKWFSEVDQAFKFLKECDEDLIAVFVLDINMPEGSRYRGQDTQEGRRTGLFVFRELVGRFPEASFLILTAIDSSDIRGELNVDEQQKVAILSKSELRTDQSERSKQLAERINALITFPTWYVEFIIRCDYLKTLEKGWDTYDGEPINHDILESAQWVVKSFANSAGKAPFVVPIRNGSIQLEYRKNGIHLELRFITGTTAIMNIHPFGEDGGDTKRIPFSLTDKLPINTGKVFSLDEELLTMIADQISLIFK